MLYDSLQILEGSKIVNMTVSSGASFPETAYAGQLFFKTDVSKMYVYSGTAWGEILRASSSASDVPRITSVTVTDSSFEPTGGSTINTAGGYVKMAGAGFTAGCIVLVDSTAAPVVTVTSGEELRVQLPAKTAGTYLLYAVNSDGGTGIFVAGVTYA